MPSAEPAPASAARGNLKPGVMKIELRLPQVPIFGVCDLPVSGSEGTAGRMSAPGVAGFSIIMRGAVSRFCSGLSLGGLCRGRFLWAAFGAGLVCAFSALAKTLACLRACLATFLACLNAFRAALNLIFATRARWRAASASFFASAARVPREFASGFVFTLPSLTLLLFIILQMPIVTLDEMLAPRKFVRSRELSPDCDTGLPSASLLIVTFSNKNAAGWIARRRATVQSSAA